MNVTYFEKERIFKLDTPNTSYLLGIVDEENFIGHIYYGKRLQGHDIAYRMRTQEAPFVPSQNNRERCSFYDCFPFEYPTAGLGDYRESCLSVRTMGGYLGCNLSYVSHRILEGKPQLEGLPATFADKETATTLELTCVDNHIGMKVLLYYTAFCDTDVITRSVKIINEGTQAFYLTKVLSACLDMDNQDYEMISLHGSWARERHIQRKKVGYGIQKVSSFRGESSHQDHPFLALVSPSTTQEMGEVYAMNFVYSGNFQAQAEVSQFDSIRMSMGIHPENFCWKLEQGESFQAPEVVMVYSSQGLDGMTTAFHHLYKRHLIRGEYKDKKRPILINNWEATYFNFTTEKLLSIAKEASGLGIEMLVMDDGWFGARSSDNCALGDWQVNEEKLPGGLKYLVDEVNKLGMKFGIWFEPEMISPDSNLYRAHPDWAIAIPGRVATESRQQYVLDLSRQEVVDYVYECVAKILRSANIEYVKWDMNRSMADVYASNVTYDYVIGVYDFLEKLTSKYPNILIEGCSGGGGRFDAGMLYYTPQIWCSDNTDAINRTRIQYGTSFFYPVAAMGSHVSAVPDHQTGRVTSLHTRGVVAMSGTFGYELNPALLSVEEKAEIRMQLAKYREHQELIREGNYYRLSDPFQDDLAAWMVVSEDQNQALVSAVRLTAEANPVAAYVTPRGLAEDAFYLEKTTGKVYAGAALMEAGILLPAPKGEYEAYQIMLQRVTE